MRSPWCSRVTGMFVRVVLVVAVALAVAAPEAAEADAGSGGISYKTFFQDPGANPAPDHSLEQHAIDLIDATPSGERITFAFRDFNSDAVTDALIRAHDRGVTIDGVIDGGEWTRTAVQRLRAALGPDHAVVCGYPDFFFNSCIANTVTGPLHNSLQHNKFLTFSRLADGRSHVVLETSENFYGPSQFTYYNDMVEIDGDAKLYAAYGAYVADMQAQVRSDDHYIIASGDDGRNTIYLSPRRQASLDTDDTIVDRLNEVGCSRGGAPDGHGLIRVANMAFRSERAVIMDKLVALQRAGCDIDVIISNADGDILAGLLSAGIPVHPLFLRAVGTRPQVMVHDKFFLIDAINTTTRTREKTTYAGTSNWRPDEQKSDDLLLRIIDDGVYNAYSRYWGLIASRAASDQSRPGAGKDTVAPSSALTVRPDPNDAGWNRDDVTVRIAASDGHNVGGSGLQRLHVEMSGAQNGAWDFTGETAGYNVQELPITAEGDTTVTYYAVDNQGNAEPPRSMTVHLDKTAPAITGLPQDCRLWPPNHAMIHVADLAAADFGSGLDTLRISASSDAPSDAGDVAIVGGSVDLRAEKGDRGAARTYVISATATDAAGNARRASATCVVPSSLGVSDK